MNNKSIIYVASDGVKFTDKENYLKHQAFCDVVKLGYLKGKWYDKEGYIAMLIMIGFAAGFIVGLLTKQ